MIGVGLAKAYRGQGYGSEAIIWVRIARNDGCELLDPGHTDDLCTDTGLGVQTRESASYRAWCLRLEHWRYPTV